ncbi:MAG: carboxypeptidase-like regulatory domain-containing protein [Gemmatimonadaceae bacterium]|nr:carboxypeptidase-like regulatory domain-containing protein [Gemmatimonadaceae bacterium]
MDCSSWLPVARRSSLGRGALAARLSLVVGLLGALLTGRPASAQVLLNTGTITGVVRAAPTNVALPYAVIAIGQVGIERFSGADGRYVLTQVPAGSFQLQVRRIGFVPQTFTVTVTAGATTTLDITLVQVPVRLTAMLVRPVEPCLKPGLPDPKKEPGIATLVGLLRENADTYRTLVQQHPYAYAIYRALGSTLGDSARVTNIAAERIDGIRAVRYKPGKVVSTERGQSTMQLPTVLDLSDKAFIENHCFHYRGTSQQNGATWFSLEVRAAEKIKSPDVHGIFWLDSATAQLRRMELELSKPDKLPSQLRTIQAVAVRTTFLEIAPGLSVVDDVCAINFLRNARTQMPHPLELQHVQAVAFTATAPPDVPPRREFPNPTWIAGGRMKISELSCSEIAR